MNKAYLDNVLDNSVHFSEHSCAWKIILPMLLVNKYVLDTSDGKLAKLGLQRSDSDVLASLFFNNNLLSPTQLYEAMLFSSGGMTKVLKRLEERGLISRIPSTDDRRSLLVRLEEKGAKLISSVLLEVAEYQSQLLSVLDEEEKRVIETAFKKLAYVLLVDKE